MSRQIPSLLETLKTISKQLGEIVFYETSVCETRDMTDAIDCDKIKDQVDAKIKDLELR